MSTCRQCSAAVEQVQARNASGEEGGVCIAFSVLPVFECANGHRRFLAVDFPVRLIETLRKSDSAFTTPAAAEKGLFKKRKLCPACGAGLPEAPGGQASAHAELALKEGKVGVEVSVPVYRCPGCGKDASESRKALQGPVLKAAANAFRAASIQPG
jgi:hypothetical protein